MPPTGLSKPAIRLIQPLLRSSLLGRSAYRYPYR